MNTMLTQPKASWSLSRGHRTAWADVEQVGHNLESSAEHLSFLIQKRTGQGDDLSRWLFCNRGY